MTGATSSISVKKPEQANSENHIPTADTKATVVPSPSTAAVQKETVAGEESAGTKLETEADKTKVGTTGEAGPSVDVKSNDKDDSSTARDAKEVDGSVCENVHNVESEQKGSANAEDSTANPAKMSTTEAEENLQEKNDGTQTVNETVDKPNNEGETIEKGSETSAEVKEDTEVLEEYSEEDSEDFINVDDLLLDDVRRKGTEYLEEKEYERAIVCLGRALELGIEAAGGNELAEDLAVLYLEYGHALLLNYEQSTDVLAESNGPATVAEAMKETEDLKAKVEELLASRPVVVETDVIAEKNIEVPCVEKAEESVVEPAKEVESKSPAKVEEKAAEVAKVEEKAAGDADTTKDSTKDEVKDSSNEEEADDSRAFQMLDIARSIFEKYVDKIVPRSEYRLVLSETDIKSGGAVPDLSFIEKIELPVDAATDNIDEKKSEITPTDKSIEEKVEKKAEENVKESTSTAPESNQTFLKIAENLAFVHRRLGELYLAQDQHAAALDEFVRGVRVLECRFALGVHPVCCRQICLLLAQCLQWLGHMNSAKLMYTFSKKLYEYIISTSDDVLTKYRLPSGDESRTKATNVVEDLEIILTDIQVIISETEKAVSDASKAEVNIDESGNATEDDARLTALKNSLPKGVLESIEGTKNAFDESTFGESEAVVDVEPRRKKRPAEEPLEKTEAKLARVD